MADNFGASAVVLGNRGIVIAGPPGAGKSQLARNVFELKKQRQSLKGRFVEVNCATLRGDGAGSALFGQRPSKQITP